MRKLSNIELLSNSFYVGALFPFVEDGKLFLMTVQNLDKYKSGEVQTKLPGGSAEREYASSTKYFERLEEIMAALNFDRRANLLILNQEYSRRAQFEDHPDKKGILWILQTMVLKCLESTGYYPADLDPWLVDIAEKSNDHYQYYLEVKEWWDQSGEVVQSPVPDPEFKPLDKDILGTRDKFPLLEFEEYLIESHCRPVEFYVEHLRSKALQARQDKAE